MSEVQKPYQFLKSNDHIMLRLTGALEHDMAKLFESEFPAQIVEPYFHWVINCEHLSEIPNFWIRALLNLGKALKSVNKEMRFILVSKKIIAIFKSEGVDQSFKALSSLREALADLGLVTKKQLDTDFINPFLTGTIDVLKIQARTSCKPGKIYLKQEKDKFLGDISGVIGLISSSFNGSVVISFPETTFLKIISRMLGEEHTSLTKEIADGAGELTNMIFGSAKVILNEKGYGIKTALPSVITGKDHSVSALTSGPIVVVPFETDVGSFFVEICLSG